MKFKRITAALIAVTVICGANTLLSAGEYRSVTAVAANEEYTEVTEDGVKYAVYAVHAEVARNIGIAGDVKIASVVNGVPVTIIGWRAFEDCKELTSITIPNGVTSIDDRAFCECSGLTSITLPDGITSIGDDAFVCCSKLTSITLPDGVTSIGSDAFDECSGLTSIIIPDGVTTIGDWTFYECSALTSITLPDSVTSISDKAIKDNSNVTIYGYEGSREELCKGKRNALRCHRKVHHNHDCHHNYHISRNNDKYYHYYKHQRSNDYDHK